LPTPQRQGFDGRSQVSDGGCARNLDGRGLPVGSRDCPEVLTQLRPYQRLCNIDHRSVFVRVQARAQLHQALTQPLQVCPVDLGFASAQELEGTITNAPREKARKGPGSGLAVVSAAASSVSAGDASRITIRNQDR
jgi:hypothetical protein